MFGRHFVTDILFAGIITILIVVALYRLLIHPARRNDAMIERGLERFSVMLHRGTGALLAGAGAVLAHAASTLKETGQNLHNRVA